MNERAVEIPWAISQARPPTLDVGCTESSYLTRLSGIVDGIDIRSTPCIGLRKQFVGDVRTASLEDQYRTILAISTLEHIGMESATYGTGSDDEAYGDRAALAALAGLLAPGGRILFTVPFGMSHDVYSPTAGYFRQYDRARITRLCGSLAFRYEVWVKDADVTWVPLAPGLAYLAEALDYDNAEPSARAVALIEASIS